MTAAGGTSGALIEVSDVSAGYGAFEVLHGVNLRLAEHEVVTILGPNGAGKSTLLKVIMGYLPVRTGSVLLRGGAIDALRPDERVRRRLAFVPQLDNVFPSLTVEENLDLAVVGADKEELRSRRDEVYEVFAPLVPARRRQAGLLSGGQRQMLAMARAPRRAFGGLVPAFRRGNLRPDCCD